MGAGWSSQHVLVSVSFCRVVLPQVWGDVATWVDLYAPALGAAAACWLQVLLHGDLWDAEGELLFGWSNMLPSQTTSCNNSVSSGLWWGPCIHGFLLMWLQGWLNSFPNHSLPAMVIRAHLWPSCSAGSSPLFGSMQCVSWRKWGGVGSTVRFCHWLVRAGAALAAQKHPWSCCRRCVVLS